ncbi:hypothetical protein D3C80_1119280 [compost metagenome]
MAIDRMPGGEIFNAQYFITRGMRFVRIKGGEFAAHHHCDNVIFAHTCCVAGANVLSVADNTDGVRYRFHLVQLVRNINAGNAVVLQVADDV